MKYFFVLFFELVLLHINLIKSQSEEYYECISPKKMAYSSSDCISVKIPEKDGFTCCSMKITMGKKLSYQCFPLENRYIKNETLFNLYVSSKKNLKFFFLDSGGEIEIECSNNLIQSENFEKYSEEYLNCYNYNLKRAEDENNCLNNDIPIEDGTQCCYLESYQYIAEGNIKIDKRCYMIPNEYLTKEKTLKNYFMEATNTKNLDNIYNTNVTIKCKNYDTYKLKTKTLINQTAPPLNINPTTILNNNQKTDEAENNIKNTDQIINTDNYVIIDSTNIPNKNDNNSKIYPRPNKSEKGIDAGIIVLIIIGALIFIGAIVAIIIFCKKKKSNLNLKNKRNKADIAADIKV